MFGWLTKKRLFELHGWLGLNLGLPLFVICLSGTFAVMSPEIDWLINPAMRVTPPQDIDAETLSWGTLVDRIEAKYPAAIVSLIYAGPDRRSAYRASVTFGPGDLRHVYIDPYTGNVRGQGMLFNVKSFFRIFHKQFYILRGDYWPHGRIFVCVFSIVLLLSAVTGLMFYKQWWRALWTLRLNRSRRVFWSDLHRMIGVWSLLLAILFAVTGLWYLTAQVLEDFDLKEHVSFAEFDPAELAGRPPNIQPVPLDQMVDNAQAAYPGLEITGLFLNRRRGSGLTVVGNGPAVLTGDTTDQVHVHPYTGEVLRLIRADELSAGPRLVAAVDPLHFGRFGGLVTKIIWTLAGLALSVGILVGVYIWWLRVTRGETRWFKKNRLWSILSLTFNLALIALAAFSTYVFITTQLNGPRQSKPAHRLDQQSVGPWQVGAYKHGRFGEPGAMISFDFITDGEPNLREAYAWIGPPQRPDGTRALRITQDRAFLPVRSTPDQTADQNQPALHLQLVDWQGNTHTAAYPITSNAQAPTQHMSPPQAPSIPAPVTWIVTTFFILTTFPLIAWLTTVH